jgi:hypothetical protein
MLSFKVAFYILRRLSGATMAKLQQAAKGGFGDNRRVALTLVAIARFTELRSQKQ